MYQVRDQTPVRRTETTENPRGSSWSKHKPDLKEDFHSCCGYCGSFDGFRHTYYEVDHFVPKSLFVEAGNIGLCDYENLTYSCKFCNGAKSNKWPTADESYPNDGSRGFIDACDSDYEEHLFREESGRINYKTELGKWMVEVGFKFDERHLEVSLLWNLKELRKWIDVLVLQLNQFDVSSEEYQQIKRKAEELSFQYFLSHQDLIDFYES